MRVGFLFDNDGVLVDTTEFHWQSWVELIEEEPRLNVKFEDFRVLFGKRNDLILKAFIPDISLDESRRLAARKEELFRRCARGRVGLIPGIEPLLQQLKEANIPRIIASSTPPENLEMYLETTPLGKYFESYVSAEEVAHGKPAPDVFIAAAERLGLEPERTIIVEDAPAGLQAARASGGLVVALETSHKIEELENYDLAYRPEALDMHVLLKVFQEKRGLGYE